MTGFVKMQVLNLTCGRILVGRELRRRQETFCRRCRITTNTHLQHSLAESKNSNLTSSLHLCSYSANISELFVSACDPFLINVLKPARGRFSPHTRAVMGGRGGEVVLFLIPFGCFVQINSDNKPIGVAQSYSDTQERKVGRETCRMVNVNVVAHQLPRQCGVREYF